MADRPIVYVIQAPHRQLGVDLTSAHEFGRVEFILPAFEQPSLEPEKAMHELRRVFDKLTPNDYITSIGGDHAGIFLAGAVLNEIADDPVHWLRWERKRYDPKNPKSNQTGFYVPVKIDFDS